MSESTYTKAELSFLAKHSSNDATRLHLSAVYFAPAAGHVVATDGHRLAIRVSDTDAEDARRVSFMVSRADLLTVAKAMGKNDRAIFEAKGVAVTVRIEGGASFVFVDQSTRATFPPYLQVIGTQGEGNRVGLSGSYLAEACELAKFCGRTGSIELTTSGEHDPIHIWGRSAELGAAFGVVVMPVRDPEHIRADMVARLHASAKATTRAA